MTKQLWIGIVAVAATLVGYLATAAPSAAHASGAPDVVYQKSVAVKMVAGKLEYQATVALSALRP
jgi:hypothetical protein